MRSLKPAGNVLGLVDCVAERKDVNLHVRMEGAAGMDIHSYDSPDNWQGNDHEVLQKWLENSHFSNFMTRVDHMLDTNDDGEPDY